MMFPLKSCVAFVVSLASPFHAHKEKPKPHLMGELEKALTHGYEASPFADQIRKLAEEDLSTEKRWSDYDYHPN